MNAIISFTDAMRCSGIIPPAEIIADGTLHRFHIEGDHPGTNNGYYVFHPDNPPAGAFGCWKRDIDKTWSSKHFTEMSSAERIDFKERLDAWKRQNEEERQQRQEDCRKWCAYTWKNAEYANNDHPYLKIKGVNAHGLKVYKGRLLIPVQDMDGTIHGFQSIAADGTKKFQFATNKHGHFFKIGKSKDSTVIVCEGYATGASIHQATGHAVVIAFDAGNLLPVAESIRSKFLDMTIIIAADDDHATEGNPGLTKATKAGLAVDGLLALPAFPETRGEKDTDFNDLARLSGLEIVKKCIEMAQPIPSPSLGMETSIAEDNESPASDMWPVPLLFGEIDTPEIPADLLPGWLGAYSKAVAETTQTPQGLAVMFALSTIAACLQKRFEVCPYGDDYTEPMSIWTVTALEPGNRKTAVKNAFCTIITQWEQEKMKQLAPKIKENKHRRDINLKSIDQLKARAAKPGTSTAEREELLQEIDKLELETPNEIVAPRLWSDDVTPERLQALLSEHGERMALLSDEGGIFEVMSGLYSNGKMNLNVFLQSHAGAPVRVDRQGRSVMLNKPALTFGLTVQPSVIGDLASGNKVRFRGNGTLARFLYCIPESSIGTRDVTKRSSIPESVKSAYHAGVMALLTIEAMYDERGNEQPRIISLAPDALRMWQTFSQYIESKQGPNGDFYSFQDWTSKLPGAALRIAGLLHVVEHGEENHEIKGSTMEHTLDLCDLLICHARKAFDLMVEDSAVQDAKMILKWIVSKGERCFKQGDVYKVLRRFNDSERLSRAIKILISRSILSEPIRKGVTGRPSIVFEVNPAVFSNPTV